MKYYKWMKTEVAKPTMLEVTKDYFADGDDFINEKNGWEKLDNQFIDIDWDEKDGDGDGE